MSKLCEGVLDNHLFRYMEWLIINGHGGYDTDRLKTALKWVKADLKKVEQEAFKNEIKELKIEIVKGNNWIFNFNGETVSVN